MPKRPWIPKKIVKIAEATMKSLVTGAFAVNTQTHNRAFEQNEHESTRQKLEHKKHKGGVKMNTPDDYSTRGRELTH